MRRLHKARDAAALFTIEEDITGRFLRIRSQASIFDDLGSNDRHILDGQVNHSMLCDRSVSVAHHPFLMKLPSFFLGCRELSRLKGRCAETRLEVDISFLNELQQIAPQALPTPAVVCEQYGHDFFRQVLQGIDWLIGIRHIWSKNSDFFPSEVIAHMIGAPSWFPSEKPSLGSSAEMACSYSVMNSPKERVARISTTSV